MADFTDIYAKNVIANRFYGGIAISDGPNLDAFSRLRVSPPQGIFDAQFTYNLNQLRFEQITAEANAAIAHDAKNRCALMTFSSTPTGGKAYMQSYEHVRYQPGRSQAIFITFNFGAAAANTTKFAGYCDGTNGVELRLSPGGDLSYGIYSGTDNGDEVVNQTAWNIDKLDGRGPSGFTLDITKTQIAVIDLQALYVGRVRVGFDIDGLIVYVHSFKHANLVAMPYIQSASLPVRCGMVSTGAASTTMRFICCAVVSEGGQEEDGGVPLSVSGAITASSGADTHILSIRPKATFNEIVNRTKIIPDSVDIVVTGSNPVEWKLVAGQALTTPTFADVNATYSAVECLAGAGTLSGTPAIVLQSGYIPATAQSKGQTNPQIGSRIPLTLTAAGAARALGTLTVLVAGVGGTSACRATLNWRELR